MAAQVNDVLNHWGPALLVCFTVVLGLFYQDGRLNDLKDSFNKRWDDLNQRISSLEISLNRRIDDLEKRLDDRLKRLESPLYRQ